MSRSRFRTVTRATENGSSNRSDTLSLVHGEQAEFVRRVDAGPPLEQRRDIELRQPPFVQRPDPLFREVVMVPVARRRIVGRHDRGTVEAHETDRGIGAGGAAGAANRNLARLSIVHAEMMQRALAFGTDQQVALAEAGFGLLTSAPIMVNEHILVQMRAATLRTGLVHMQAGRGAARAGVNPREVTPLQQFEAGQHLQLMPEARRGTQHGIGDQIARGGIEARRHRRASGVGQPQQRQLGGVLVLAPERDFGKAAPDRRKRVPELGSAIRPERGAGKVMPKARIIAEVRDWKRGVSRGLQRLAQIRGLDMAEQNDRREVGARLAPDGGIGDERGRPAQGQKAWRVRGLKFSGMICACEAFD